MWVSLKILVVYLESFRESFALYHISTKFPFVLLRIPKVIGGHTSSCLLQVLVDFKWQWEGGSEFKHTVLHFSSLRWTLLIVKCCLASTPFAKILPPSILVFPFNLLAFQKRSLSSSLSPHPLPSGKAYKWNFFALLWLTTHAPVNLSPTLRNVTKLLWIQRWSRFWIPEKFPKRCPLKHHPLPSVLWSLNDICDRRAVCWHICTLEASAVAGRRDAKL